MSLNKTYLALIFFGIFSLSLLVGLIVFNYRYEAYGQQAIYYLNAIETTEKLNTAGILALKSDGSAKQKEKAVASFNTVKASLEDIQRNKDEFFQRNKDDNWANLLRNSKAASGLVEHMAASGDFNDSKAIAEILALYTDSQKILNQVESEIKDNKALARKDYDRWSMVMLVSCFLIILLLGFLIVGFLKQKNALAKDIENVKNSDAQRSNELSKYVEAISHGNFDNLESVESNDDELSGALKTLKEQFELNQKESDRRSWVNTGLAEINEILRLNNNINELSNQIITYVIKYMEANQGCIFIASDAEQDSLMEMKAMYAYGRKKFVERSLSKGQGLAGQCWIEGQTIYLTDVPEEYVKVTSGLGESLPNSVLIVPLKVNELTYGILEMASFKRFEQYQIEFIEKLSEVIASTVANTITNETTNKLLQETQLQAEAMRAQEEEMRQNMEELQATQEEMSRVSRDMTSQIEAINATMASIEFDLDGVILDINENYLEILGYGKAELLGERHAKLVSKEDKMSESYREFWDQLKEGRAINGYFKRQDKKGNDIHIRGIYSPLCNAAGKPIKVVQLAYDITNEVKQQAAVQQQEKYVTGILDSSSDNIFVIDRSYCLKTVNKAFQDLMDSIELDIKIGDSVFGIFEGSEHKKHQAYYDRVFQGEQIEEVDYIERSDKYYNTIYRPIKNEAGEIDSCVVYAKDLTELMKAKNESEKALLLSQQQKEEMLAQEEELRQNMEELSATQEEMARVLDQVQKNENYMQDLIDASVDTIVMVDKDLNLTIFNEKYKKTWEAKDLVLRKGMPLREIYTDDTEFNKHKDIISKALKGEYIEAEMSKADGGVTSDVKVTYTPVRGVDDKIEVVAIFAREINRS